MRRRSVITLLVALASLLALSAAAEAVVVNDAGTTAGVAMVPGSSTDLAAGSAATNCDPWLTPDLSFPPGSQPLCFHGGAVMNQNETFTLTWDPGHSYWQATRQYIEQFLSNVEAGSGTLTSPYAITSQYFGSNGRAANSSVFGGGCIDYGATGGYTCKFGDTTGNGAGHDYTIDSAAGCTGSATGMNQYSELPDGGYTDATNKMCVTDAQIKAEIESVLPNSGLLDHVKAGYTPLIVILTPAGVEDCVDSAGALCSANGGSNSQFCSYHSKLNLGGTEISYVVQPWTVGWDSPSPCDEPDAQPSMPTPKDPPPNPQTLATAVGARLISPLSRSQIAAIINPALDAWFTANGSEIGDNGCIPLAKNDDQAIVGGATYFLQREFNNAGAIQVDPNSPLCAPDVALSPAFVVPGLVNAGDVVQLDGSSTASTLIVPKANYIWSFGDGGTAFGPSVTHAYTKGGTYIVKLTVLDRGGYSSSLSQTITVLSPKGKPVTTTPPPGHPALKARLTLMPESLRSALRHGVSVAVTANRTADGIALLSISRSAASRAHIKHGRGASVVIGRGTVSGVKAGTVKLHLRLPQAIAKQLSHLRHLTLTVRLTLVGAGGARVAIDAAGRY